MRLSEEFHAYVKEQNQELETMEDTVKRLIGGPEHDEVSGLISTDTAEEMKTGLENRTRTRAKKRWEMRQKLMESFDLPEEFRREP